jgi:hypothetical protein
MESGELECGKMKEEQQNESWLGQKENSRKFHVCNGFDMIFA